MDCPRCGAPLRELAAGEVDVDSCAGCGGVWVDRFELGRLEAERVPGVATAPPGDLDARLDCPRCPDVVLMRRFASAARDVAVDECPACAGLWLDAGELAAARAAHDDALARRAAGEQAAPAALDERVVPLPGSNAREVDTLAETVRGLGLLGRVLLDLR